MPKLFTRSQTRSRKIRIHYLIAHYFIWYYAGSGALYPLLQCIKPCYCAKRVSGEIDSDDDATSTKALLLSNPLLELQLEAEKVTKMMMMNDLDL